MIVKVCGIKQAANLAELETLEVDMIGFNFYPPSYCEAVSEFAHVIKVFRVGEDFDFEQTEAFEECSLLFLFDTYTEDFGGSGRKFNWKLLDAYTGDTPFLLSGGIGPKDAKRLLKIEHEQFVGIDINSGFEMSPGVKDLELIEGFLEKIRVNETE